MREGGGYRREFVGGRQKAEENGKSKSPGVTVSFWKIGGRKGNKIVDNFRRRETNFKMGRKKKNGTSKRNRGVAKKPGGWASWARPKRGTTA